MTTTDLPEDLPNYTNLHRRDHDGQVTLDANHGHTGLAGVIGTALPLANGSGWVWITAGAPGIARTATTEADALDELLADTLASIHDEDAAAWDRILNRRAAA